MFLLLSLLACTGGPAEVSTLEGPVALIETKAPAPAPAADLCEGRTSATPAQPWPDDSEAVVEGDAQTLVAAGCQFDKAGDFRSAHLYFRAALAKADEPSVRFLRARAAAQARLKAPARVCDDQTWLSAILEDIVAIRGDAALVARVKDEPAFQVVHQTIRYRKVVGDTNAVGLAWYKRPVAGVYGSQVHVFFEADGAARIEALGAEDPEGAELKFHTTTQPKVWTESPGGFTIDAGEGPVAGTLDEAEGALKDAEGNQIWGDIDSECEA